MMISYVSYHFWMFLVQQMVTKKHTQNLGIPDPSPPYLVNFPKFYQYFWRRPSLVPGSSCLFPHPHILQLSPGSSRTRRRAEQSGSRAPSPQIAAPHPPLPPPAHLPPPAICHEGKSAGASGFFILSIVNLGWWGASWDSWPLLRIEKLALACSRQ